jgi:hypothetical protein
LILKREALLCFLDLIAMENRTTVENLVRRIISETNSFPSPVRGTTSQSVDSPFVSPEEELNRRFNIPRNPQLQQSRQDATIPSGSTQQCAQPEITNSLNGRTDLSGASQLQSLSTRYNPQQNYGYTNYNNNSRRRRTPRGQSTSLPYSRNRTSTSRQMRQSSSTRSEAPTLKEVILLPKPGFTDVPKYKKKYELNKDGLIFDSVPIERSLSEHDLRKRIQEVFEHKLKGPSGITSIG